jgi:hypothetical protein
MLRADVLGYFVPGSVPVVCSKAAEHALLGLTTIIHERNHEHITRTTSTGQYAMALRMGWRVVNAAKSNTFHLERALEAILESSILTFEGCATWEQLKFVSKVDEREAARAPLLLPTVYRKALNLYTTIVSSFMLPETNHVASVKTDVAYAAATAAMSTSIFKEFPEFVLEQTTARGEYLVSASGSPDERLSALVGCCRANKSPLLDDIRERAMYAAISPHADDADSFELFAIRGFMTILEDAGFPVDWDGFDDAARQHRMEALLHSIDAVYDLSTEWHIEARSLHEDERLSSLSFEDVPRISGVPAASVDELEGWVSAQILRGRHLAAAVHLYPSSHWGIDIAALEIDVSAGSEVLTLRELGGMVECDSRNALISLCSRFKIPVVVLSQLFEILEPADLALFATSGNRLYVYVHQISANVIRDAGTKWLGPNYKLHLTPLAKEGWIVTLRRRRSFYKWLAVTDIFVGLEIASCVPRRNHLATSPGAADEFRTLLAGWMASYGPVGELVARIYKAISG